VTLAVGSCDFSAIGLADPAVVPRLSDLKLESSTLDWG